MKKTIAAIFVIVIIAFAGILYFTSNLSRDQATASFTNDEKQEGLNELRVTAPYGYYVIQYSVVPRYVKAQGRRKPFRVGSRGVGNNPQGLFGYDSRSSNFFPDTGTIDEIPTETHVRIASNLNPAATMAMPEDERILSRCGIYILVTKDHSVFGRLPSIVESWPIDAE